jgi:regulatory protein
VRREPTRASTNPAGEQADPDGDPETAARAICLRLLTDRARTRAELAGVLRKRGIPDSVAEGVLSRFSEVGLIDDATFAEQWVRTRHSTRGLARRALAAELRRKGVDGEVAGQAVAALDRDSEAQRARELVDRRLRTLSANDARVVPRLVGMLARKGYPPGLSYQVVREALREHGVDGVPDEADFELDHLGDS